MKKHLHKIFISILILMVGFGVIYLLTENYRATESGSIELIITDDQQNIVFEGFVDYQKNDTFFDILNRRFELTCANAFYQFDTSCQHAFYIGNAEQKVILGIKGDDFEIESDWRTTFIALYVYHEGRYVLAEQGFNQLKFVSQGKYMIRVDSVNT